MPALRASPLSLTRFCSQALIFATPRSYPQFARPDSDARVAILCALAPETAASLSQVLIAWMRQRETPILALTALTAVDPRRKPAKCRSGGRHVCVFLCGHRGARPG